MDIEPSDLIVGMMMLVFGVVGLILASGAVDDEMYVFGLSLFGFACVFLVGQIRHHFDRRDAARVAVRARRDAPRDDVPRDDVPRGDAR